MGFAVDEVWHTVPPVPYSHSVTCRAVCAGQTTQPEYRFSPFTQSQYFFRGLAQDLHTNIASFNGRLCPSTCLYIKYADIYTYKNQLIL